LASVVGGSLLTNLLKGTFDRPRPDVVPHAVRVFTSSFPSGHAALSAVTYLSLGALLASEHSSYGIKTYFLSLALLLTIAVGLSRIYLGVHYPTDVLAGWCAGAAWAILCWLVWSWFKNRSATESHL
jgi:undecaprenyl-diphosphatase